MPNLEFQEMVPDSDLPATACVEIVSLIKDTNFKLPSTQTNPISSSDENLIYVDDTDSENQIYQSGQYSLSWALDNSTSQNITLNSNFPVISSFKRSVDNSTIIVNAIPSPESSELLNSANIKIFKLNNSPDAIFDILIDDVYLGSAPNIKININEDLSLASIIYRSTESINKFLLIRKNSAGNYISYSPSLVELSSTNIFDIFPCGTSRFIFTVASFLRRTDDGGTGGGTGGGTEEVSNFQTVSYELSLDKFSNNDPFSNILDGTVDITPSFQSYVFNINTSSFTSISAFEGFQVLNLIVVNASNNRFLMKGTTNLYIYDFFENTDNLDLIGSIAFGNNFKASLVNQDSMLLVFNTTSSNLNLYSVSDLNTENPDSLLTLSLGDIINETLSICSTPFNNDGVFIGFLDSQGSMEFKIINTSLQHTVGINLNSSSYSGGSITSSSFPTILPDDHPITNPINISGFTHSTCVDFLNTNGIFRSYCLGLGPQTQLSIQPYFSIKPSPEIVTWNKTGVMDNISSAGANLSSFNLTIEYVSYPTSNSEQILSSMDHENYIMNNISEQINQKFIAGVLQWRVRRLPLLTTRITFNNIYVQDGKFYNQDGSILSELYDLKFAVNENSSDENSYPILLLFDIPRDLARQNSNDAFQPINPGGQYSNRSFVYWHFGNTNPSDTNHNSPERFIFGTNNLFYDYSYNNIWQGEDLSIIFECEKIIDYV